MIYTYTDMIPSPVSNAEVKQRYKDGILHGYNIKPMDGYVMHDKFMDSEDIDTGDLTLGYRTAEASVWSDYDFVENSREFYCVREGM